MTWTGPPPAHRATTAHLQALYPFVSDAGLASEGPLIGRDLLGGPFRFDPWDLYRTGRITNPNVLVVGQVGRGKSTFVKTLVWRQLAFGRRAWIIDPKGEYGALSRAACATSLALVPGGRVRLNPLDLPDRTRGESPDRVRPRTDLTTALLESSLGRALGPDERAAVDMAVAGVSSRCEQPTLQDVVLALLEPDTEAARSLHTERSRLAADGRVPALELRRLVSGDLAGMFDGPSSIRVSVDADVVVLDLSSTFGSPALPLIMTCATAWLQASLAQASGVKRLVVMDEAWAVLSDLPTARWAQASFKLSRAFGVANVVVVHRVSDLRAAGADGSASQKLAEGLLADSETRVVFGQATSEAEATKGLLGLSRAEAELVPRLPRGVALWRVADRSYLVQHLVGPSESELVDTDGAMVDTPPGRFGPGPAGDRR